MNTCHMKKKGVRGRKNLPLPGRGAGAENWRFNI